MFDSWKDFFISIFNRGIFFDASTPTAYLINKIVNICLLLIWLFTIVLMCLSPAGQEASIGGVNILRASFLITSAYYFVGLCILIVKDRKSRTSH